MWPPPRHTLGKTYRHLRAGGWVCETPEDRSVVVHLDEDRLNNLFAVLAEALTNREMEDNLFINFTPTSIYDPKFCLRSTVESVDEAPLEPERVVFEVTETEKAGDIEHLRNIVDYYREQGFRVALDDMGSGYSSLNLIHRLRPDFIKLDMQLVRGVDDDPYKAVVAQKVLERAQSLDVETIVEGVETHEELEWARDRGATYAQGYLIARPASPPLKRLDAIHGQGSPKT